MIQIHESSVIEHGAIIGDYTSIWHFCHVEARASIGENCNLGQNVYVGNDSTIGNACRIGNSVGVFSHVCLEDFVFCGPFMVFTHIGFPRACVNRHGVFAKTKVGTGVTLGANSTVIPGLEIGHGAFLAAGSVLTRDCKAWSLMVGTPARHVGWVSAYGEKIPLPLSGEGEWACSHTGDKYILLNDELTRVPGVVDILKYSFGKKLARFTARS